MSEAAPHKMLGLPATLVGGIAYEDRAYSILAHEGFERGALERARQFGVRNDDAPEIGKVYLLLGSRSNPLFSWPVYAKRVR